MKGNSKTTLIILILIAILLIFGIVIVGINILKPAPTPTELVPTGTVAPPPVTDATWERVKTSLKLVVGTSEKTVPHLFPELPEGGQMPEVLATGFLVGMMEFACIKFINPHIEWPRQQTVGIQINLSHTAATPPGFKVTVKGRLEKVDGRKLSFVLDASDGADSIGQATHERFIIDAEKFNASVARKKSAA